MYLKLSKWLWSIMFVLRQKSLYYELKHYIHNKESYFKRIDERDRGIGKTYTLIKLAKKYKCPIIVGNSRTKDYILSRISKKADVLIANEYLIGKKFDVALCDEGISIDVINQIVRPMVNVLIGYWDYRRS